MLRTCGGFGDSPGEWAFASGFGRGTSGGVSVGEGENGGKREWGRGSACRRLGVWACLHPTFVVGPYFGALFAPTRSKGDTTKQRPRRVPTSPRPPRSTFDVPRSTHNAPTLNPNRLRIPPCTLDDRGVSNTDVSLLPVPRRKTRAVRRLHERRLTFLNSGKIPQAALSDNSYYPDEYHT